MSAIEVLKEMRSLFNESNSWEVTQERDNALYQALLALKKKENDVKRGRVEELKYILKEITKMDSNITSGDEMLEFIEKRLLELKNNGLD